MKKEWFLFLAILILLVLGGCAHSPNLEPCLTDKTYGFFSGLWHGFIIWFSFIGSWFSHNILIYAPNNNGFWYDLGFMIGLGAFGGGVSSSVMSRRG